MTYDPCDFDIDVDLSPILGRQDGPTLVSSRWYEIARPIPGRSIALQAKLNRALQNTLFYAQWSATYHRSLDRRRALRVPLISRVTLGPASHMLACDISMSGLRCSGRPPAPVMDVEFRLPGTEFPIDARVEVVSFKDANVIPLVGLRFAWIDKPYVEHIARYIATKRQKMLKAA